MSGGFPQESFRALAETEPGHYWFEARNRLVVWALRRYFPEAESFHEIGCGTGFVLAGIHDAFPRMSLSASDLFGEGLEYARKRVPTADIRQLDARELDAAQTFDVVGAFDVLEHIDKDAEVLRRLYEVVAPGGGLLVTVPQHPWLWSAVDEVACHVRRYRRADLVERVRAAGFDVTRVTSFVTLLLPLMVASRWLHGRRSGETCSDHELRVPAPINSALRAVLGLERWLLRLGLSLPAGGSLLLVAHKPFIAPPADAQRTRTSPAAQPEGVE